MAEPTNSVLATAINPADDIDGKKRKKIINDDRTTSVNIARAEAGKAMFELAIALNAASLGKDATASSNKVELTEDAFLEHFNQAKSMALDPLTKKVEILNDLARRSNLELKDVLKLEGEHAKELRASQSGAGLSNLPPVSKKSEKRSAEEDAALNLSNDKKTKTDAATSTPLTPSLPPSQDPARSHMENPLWQDLKNAQKPFICLRVLKDKPVTNDRIDKMHKVMKEEFGGLHYVTRADGSAYYMIFRCSPKGDSNLVALKEAILKDGGKHEVFELVTFTGTSGMSCNYNTTAMRDEETSKR